MVARSEAPQLQNHVASPPANAEAASVTRKRNGNSPTCVMRTHTANIVRQGTDTDRNTLRRNLGIERPAVKCRNGSLIIAPTNSMAAYAHMVT